MKQSKKRENKTDKYYKYLIFINKYHKGFDQTTSFGVLQVERRGEEKETIIRNGSSRRTERESKDSKQTHTILPT